MKEDKKKKEEKAILAKLQLLANIRRQHEWVVVGQKEADDEEKAETKIDSEAPDSTPDKSKGE